MVFYSVKRFLLLLLFFLFFPSLFLQKDIWAMINSGIAVNHGRDMSRGFVVRAEMFGQLTTGLEAAWNKLKGEGCSSTLKFF